MIVIYDRSFIVLANGVTIVNYDRKSFIVQATGLRKLCNCTSHFLDLIGPCEKDYYANVK